MFKDFLVWLFYFIIGTIYLLGALTCFMSGLVVAIQWVIFFEGLGVNTELYMLGFIIIWAFVGAVLLLISRPLFRWIDKKKEAYKWSKPHMEYYLYPDEMQLELYWVDGEYKADMLTTMRKYNEDREGYKNQLKAEVEKLKMVGVIYET